MSGTFDVIRSRHAYVHLNPFLRNMKACVLDNNNNKFMGDRASANVGRIYVPYTHTCIYIF